MYATSRDWSSEIRVLLSDDCSTSKPPRLGILCLIIYGDLQSINLFNINPPNQEYNFLHITLNKQHSTDSTCDIQSGRLCSKYKINSSLNNIIWSSFRSFTYSHTGYWRFSCLLWCLISAIQTCLIMCVATMAIFVLF